MLLLYVEVVALALMGSRSAAVLGLENPMIERGRGVALWRQIEQQLADDITNGVFPEGARLPTEPELADRFGVNRHTLRRAVGSLAEQGLLRVEQGRGTFVQENVIDYLIGRRTRFSEIISAQDRQPAGRLLRAYETEPDETAAAELGLRKGELCIYLESLSEADGQPMSIGSSFFPARRFPELIPVYAETGSITKAMEHHGVGDYRRKVTRVTAVLPEAEEAALLRQASNRPVLLIESLNVDAKNVPVQFARSRFAADRTQLVFET